jgi:hypothetical protein
MSKKELIKTVIIDILALLVVIMIPKIADFLNFSFYLLEPIRIMLIIGIAHTRKSNAYLLAILMPLSAFLFSGHPFIIKMFFMALELSLNILIFTTIVKKFKYPFAAMFVAIVLSKIIYYSLEFSAVKLFLVPHSDFGFHPIWLQLILILIFSGYIAIIWRKRNNIKRLLKY